MEHDTGLEGLDQFRQYAYDDVQRYHFVHECVDKSDDVGYQWFGKMWIIFGIHRPNQFEQILFLKKIDVQQGFEIDEKPRKHQIWQQADNTIHI